MNLNANLTPRQNQIAEMLAWGEIYKGVADKLNISVRTVEATVNQIYLKTETTKVNELAAWWFCKHYNIHPVKRLVIAGVLFVALCLLFSITHNHFDTSIITNVLR